MTRSIKKSFGFAGLVALIVLFGSFGCVNNPQQITKLANDTLDDSIRYYKVAFNKGYEKAKFKNNKNIKIDNFKTEVMRFGDFIENKVGILSVPNNPSDDISSVREIFIGKHVGDSIYLSLKGIFTAASSCANSDKVRQYISQSMSSLLGDHTIDTWTSSIFGSNSSTGVTWFLKGVEIEIYRIGAQVFSDNIAGE